MALVYWSATVALPMTSADPAALEHFIRDTIPLARAMQVRVGDYARDSLQLHAPLAANVNDKGCAFAGSLSGLMTLTGWGLVTLTLQARGLDADVFVAAARTRYLAPLMVDLEARAQWAEADAAAAFIDTFNKRGKAQVIIESVIAGSAGKACTQRARFVAKRRAAG